MRFELSCFLTARATMRHVEEPVDLSRRALLSSLGALSGALLLGLLPQPGLAARNDTGTTDINAKINRYVRALQHEGRLLADESTAWCVYDFTLRKKLVSINEDIPLQSASMIKPFIALAFFYKVKERGGKFAYHKRHRRMMEAMIRRSDNRATNYFIDLLGDRPNGVERILKARAPGIFRDTTIAERIPHNGRSYRNKASAHDYSRFLYALWNDQLPYSRELKKLMNLPNRDRIFDGTTAIPDGTQVYDKTGTTAKLCGNMGILVARGKDGRRYPYIFVGIIEKSRRARHFTAWAASRGNIIREVSNLVYTDLKSIHGLV